MLVAIRNLGIRDYVEVWKNMQSFTLSRQPSSLDEIWIVQHYPVYTQGLAGRPENIFDANSIPVVQSDRGGQCTYHGPGQLVIYTLIDLNRKKLGIRSLIDALQTATIKTLEQYGITAVTRAKAPGVYVDGKKIASIGLRIRRGCSYHGLSFNISMDLSPFEGIHICGYPDLEATQLDDLDGPKNPIEVSVPIVHQLLKLLNYDGIE